MSGEGEEWICQKCGEMRDAIHMCARCPVKGCEEIYPHLHPKELSKCRRCGGSAIGISRDGGSIWKDTCANGELAHDPEKLDEGSKDDTGKPRCDLLPPLALLATAEVLAYGAKKYAPENWRRVNGWRWRYTAACLRHLFAHMRGEKIDPESHFSHLAHASCCVLFLLELEILEGVKK